MTTWARPKPKVRGRWTPPVGAGQDVGVGASSVMDLLGQFGGAVGQVAEDVFPGAAHWLNSAPSFAEHPVQALGSAAIAGLVAPTDLTKYATGIAIGGMQGAAEALGARQPGERIDVLGAARDLDASLALDERTRERLAQGASLLPPGVRELLGGVTSPNPAQSVYGILNHGEERVMPGVQGPQGASPLDPKAAHQRFQAVTPNALELGIDLTSGIALTKPITAGASALARTVRGSAPLRGLDAFTEVTSPVKDLGQKLGLSDDLPQLIRDATETTTGRRLLTTAKYGTTPAVGLEQALTTGATEEAPYGSNEWFMRAGERMLVGAIVGYGATALGLGILKFSTARSLGGLQRAAEGDSEGTKALIAGLNRARRAEADGSVIPVVQPGGNWGNAFNPAKAELSDSQAGLKAADEVATRRRVSGRASTEADEEHRIVRGVLDDLDTTRLPVLKTTLKEAEASHVANTVARDNALAAVRAAEREVTTAQKLAAAPVPTIRGVYERFLKESFQESKLLDTAVDTTDALGNAIRKVTFAPGIEAVMDASRTNPGKAVWRQTFGSTGTRGLKTLKEIHAQARAYAGQNLGAGHPWLDDVVDATIAPQRAAELTAKQAALEAAKAKHLAAQEAAAASQLPFKEAERAWTEAQAYRNAEAARASVLQDAVDRGAHAVPYMERAGKLAQAFKGGVDGEIALARKDSLGIMSRLHRDPVDPNKVWGTQGQADYDTFTLFVRAFGVADRARRGLSTTLTAADVAAGKAAHVITTKQEGIELLKGVIRDRAIDRGTLLRYVRTVGKLTEDSNKYIEMLHTGGLIGRADADEILKNFFYIRGKDLKEIITDWNPQSAQKVQQLFARGRGVEREKVAVDDVWDMSPELIAERNGLIVQLVRQNEVFGAAVASAKADPAGMGKVITDYVSRAEAHAAVAAGRVPEVQADLLRMNREITRIKRQIAGPGSGHGTLQGQLNRAQRSLQRATDKITTLEAEGKQGLKAYRDANRLKIQRQGQVKQLTEALDEAQAKLTTLKEQQPILVRIHQNAKKKAAGKLQRAPQAAHDNVLKLKRTRAAALLQEADGLERSVGTLRTPKQVQEAIGRAERLRERAADDLASAKKLEDARIPDPSDMVVAPLGHKVVPHFRNGTPELKVVPDWYADYLMGVGTPQVDAFTKLTSGVLNKFWRAAVTTYSLTFAIRNPARDVQTAMLNYSKMRSVPEFMGDYARGLGDAIGSVWGRQLEDVFAALSQSAGGRAAVSKVTGALPRVGPLKHVAGKDAAQLADDLDRLIRLKSDTERLYRARGGVSTLTETAAAGSAKLGSNVGGSSVYSGTSIANPLDLVSKMSLTMELPGRLAVFKHAMKAPGTTVEEAAYLARTVLTDFSKAGHAMRVANMALPLLNARLQGELQTWQGFRDNPQSFIMRLNASVVLPYLTAYTWNRSMYGDLLDQISPDILAKNLPVIYSSWFNPTTQREEPLYFKIPLTDVAAGVTIPLRYMLDEKYHIETDQGAELPSGKRGVWTPNGLLKQVIAGFIPTSPTPEELDPVGFLSSTMSMNPAYAVSAGLLSNWDRFRQRPVMDEEALPLWEKYHWTKPDTPLYAQAATELLQGTGLVKGRLAPVQVDYAYRMLGGGLGQSLSVPMNLLAKHIWYKGGPAPSDKMLTPEALGPDPPESLAAYINQNKLPDQRPGLQRNLSFLFGSGGNAQSIVQKYRHENPKGYRRWQATLTFQDDMQEYDVYRYEPERREILAHTEWSHAKLNDALTTLSKQRQEHRRTLQNRYHEGIYDPAERRKFVESAPGIPVGVDDAQGFMSLPQGVDVAALTARWENPTSMEPATFEMLSKLQQDEIRGRELETMARELSQQHGVQVNPDAVARAITAQQRGMQIPALMLPELYVDEWVDLWRTPPGYDADDPPELIRKAREEVLSNIVTKYGIIDEMIRAGTLDPAQDPGEQARQAVIETINAQFIRPGETYSLDVSRDKAYALSAWIRSDAEFPEFTDQQGNEVGTKEQQRMWADQINKMELTGIPRDEWSVEMRMLDRLQKYGQVQKVIELYNHPDYLEYSRWFGIGRTISQDQWEQLQSGEIAKYKLPDGRAVPPAKALQLDFMVALYRALPDGAQKRALQPKVKRIQALATPNWQNLFDIYELLPEKQRKLQDEITEIDQRIAAEREAQTAQYAISNENETL